MLAQRNVKPIHEHYINRVIFSSKEYLKSNATLFTKQKSIAPIAGFQTRYYASLYLKELQNWGRSKLEVEKKSEILDSRLCFIKWVLLGHFLETFWPQILTSYSFAAPWATIMHSISFESPDKGAIGFLLVKSIEALLRHVFWGQNYPTYIVLMWCCNVCFGQHSKYYCNEVSFRRDKIS